MTGRGDDYLRSVLGQDAYPADASAGGGSAPGAGPGVQAEIDREIRDTRLDVEADHSAIGGTPAGSPGSFLDNIVTTGGTTGGGYRFDPEAIAAKITEWEGVRDRISDHADALQAAANTVTPPSADEPAKAQARATQTSLVKAGDHATQMLHYTQAFIDSLRRANGTYVAQEEDAATAFRGRGVDDGGAAPDGTGNLYG